MKTIEEYLDIQQQNKKFGRDLRYSAGTGAFCVSVAVAVENARAFGIAGSMLFVAAVLNAIELDKGISEIDRIESDLVSQLESDLHLGKQYDIC